MAEALRPAIVEGDLDKLYYGNEPEEAPLPRKRVPNGDIYEAARAGDVDRLKVLLKRGVNVNTRDAWDSVALYYACLAGHLDAAELLLENGAICSEHTFDGDRCHYAALNLAVRALLKTYEARPPPLEPLPDALRVLFFRSGSNSRYADPTLAGGNQGDGGGYAELEDIVTPDIVFYVDGKPISAHRAILAARCGFFRRKFNKEWKLRREVRFPASNGLSFPALFSLIRFFYTNRLEIGVDDMEDLLKICKVCGCSGLYDLVDKELARQEYAEYKLVRDVDNWREGFMLLLPEDETLSAAMARLLNWCRERAGYDMEKTGESIRLGSGGSEDYADLCFRVRGKTFRCHSAVVAARSDYVRARISRMSDFSEGRVKEDDGELMVLEEHDLDAAIFEKMLHYIYTDKMLFPSLEPDFDEIEEMLDAASRYLLFPLKRHLADIVLSRLWKASPAELCRWLLIADMYGIWKLREYCLDTIAVNFESFAEVPEFRYMLRSLPRPSGDTTARTSAPSAPGAAKGDQENVLDDLREKWLEAEGAELDKRDESAKHFDRRLELLIEAVQAGNRLTYNLEKWTSFSTQTLGNSAAKAS